jgi:hypothetical protein
MCTGTDGYGFNVSPSKCKCGHYQSQELGPLRDDQVKRAVFSVIGRSPFKGLHKN